jgi:hypothetical protein
MPHLAVVLFETMSSICGSWRLDGLTAVHLFPKHPSSHAFKQKKNSGKKIGAKI